MACEFVCASGSTSGGIFTQSPAGIQNALTKLIHALLQIELTMVLRNCVYHSGLCRKAGRRSFMLGTRAVFNASMAIDHQQARLKGTLTSKFACDRLHAMHFCCCNLHQCLDSVFRSLRKNKVGWQSRVLDIFISSLMSCNSPFKHVCIPAQTTSHILG